MGKVLSIAFLVLWFVGAALPALAKSYTYPDITVNIAVQKDGSFWVEESITLELDGSFRFAFRDIAKKDVRSIADIEVFDEAIGEPFVYSRSDIDPDDPQRVGKFTVDENSDNVRVTWYFALADTTHTWVVRYHVFGGLRYFDDHDELYWNAIFPDRDEGAVVGNTEVMASLPEASRISAMRTELYTNAQESTHEVVDAKTFQFSGQNIIPGDNFTIVAGWPPGIIDRRPDQRAARLMLLPFLTGLFTFFGIGGLMTLQWVRFGNDPARKRTIVAQYEPPQGLRPAIAEAVVTSGVTLKAIAATVVDLAVRGYVAIAEIDSGWWKFGKKNYAITVMKIPDGTIFPYEHELLEAFFSSGMYQGARVTTEELKDRASELAKVMAKIRKDAAEETERMKLFYENPVEVRQRYAGIGALLIVVGWFGSGFVSQFFGGALSAILAGMGFGGIPVLIGSYFMPKRTFAGTERAEELLGFKLYLSVAERFRLEQAPLDRFAAFLPYAMVFGVEKKWAKRFEGLDVPPPTWYAGAWATGSPGSGFSASSFGSSFTSSFVGSLSRSTGTSASGFGGGGAGGGGGGGGGGGAG